MCSFSENLIVDFTGRTEMTYNLITQVAVHDFVPKQGVSRQTWLFLSLNMIKQAFPKSSPQAKSDA